MNHRFSRVCVAVLAVCCLFSPLSATAQTQQLVLPPSAALDGYLQRASAVGFTGVALIVQGDQVVLRASYGLANDAAGVAFTPETVVDVGSLAKQFTAAAILHLEQQGRLRTSDTLERFFANLPPDRAGITLHQLLTHSAGLPDVAEADLAPLSRAAAFAQILGKPLTEAPGTAYHYCNACYSMLAAVIEEVSGQPYPNYLRDHLFAPLGLQHTGFYGEARWQGMPVAHGYWNEADQGSPANWPGPYWTVMGNGGVLSTADNLARWWQALRSHQVLSPAQTDKLFARQIAQDSADSFYGYGWGIEPSPLGTLLTHNGGGIGGNSDLAYLVEHDLLMILLGNRIVYRSLGDDLPIEVRLFASDTRRQLITNLATGDLSPLPSPTFTLIPTLAVGASLIVLSAALLLAVRWRRRRSPC